MTYNIGDVVLWYENNEVVSQGIVVNTDEWITEVQLCSHQEWEIPMKFYTKTNNEWGNFVEKDKATYRIKKINAKENEQFIKERIEEIKTMINQKFNETNMKLEQIVEITEFELNKLNIDFQVTSFQDENAEFRAAVKGIVIQYFIDDQKFPITEIDLTCYS